MAKIKADMNPEAVIRELQSEIGVLKVKLSDKDKEIEDLKKRYKSVAPKADVAILYRARANIMTAGDDPNYQSGQLLKEEDFKNVPDKYKGKFEKVETVVVVESK